MYKETLQHCTVDDGVVHTILRAIYVYVYMYYIVYIYLYKLYTHNIHTIYYYYIYIQLYICSMFYISMDEHMRVCIRCISVHVSFGIFEGESTRTCWMMTMMEHRMDIASTHSWPLSRIYYY